MTCDFIFYNVKLGQCIGILPPDRTHAVMIDCGHDEYFHPVDHFQKFLPTTGYGDKRSLRVLMLTNYDHDHFSGIHKLNSTLKIESVLFPNNLTMDDLYGMKSEKTRALETVAEIRSKYNKSISDFTPPYTRRVFSLTQDELRQAGIPIETNHLSQLVFVSYGQTTICIPGDLEDRSWELMLKKPDVLTLLWMTNIMVASHHGRENGYHPGIFEFCSPDCIIMSDKPIVHGTQESMSSVYGRHVKGNGIIFSSSTGGDNDRKVLTTRSDGHIHIAVPLSGKPRYRGLQI